MSSLTPLLFVDDLLRSRAQELDQQPVLAYPESDHGTTDFELFTPRDLDRLTNGAAHHLAKRGLPPVVSSNSRQPSRSPNQVLIE